MISRLIITEAAEQTSKITAFLFCFLSYKEGKTKHGIYNIKDTKRIDNTITFYEYGMPDQQN